MIWADEYVDERDARFINDRVHANIQKDGTFSVVPQMKGGVTSPAQLRRIADVAEKYSGADGQAHRRPAHRSARHPQGGPARGLGDLGMPSGYAYGKSFRTVQDLRRHGLLPLRRRRQHRAGHRNRGPLPGPRRPRRR